MGERPKSAKTLVAEVSALACPPSPLESTLELCIAFEWPRVLAMPSESLLATGCTELLGLLLVGVVKLRVLVGLKLEPKPKESTKGELNEDETEGAEVWMAPPGGFKFSGSVPMADCSLPSRELCLSWTDLPSCRSMSSCLFRLAEFNLSLPNSFLRLKMATAELWSSAELAVWVNFNLVISSWASCNCCSSLLTLACKFVFFVSVSFKLSKSSVFLCSRAVALLKVRFKSKSDSICRPVK